MDSPPRPTETLTSLDDRAILLPAVRITVVTPEGASLEAPLGMAPLVVGTGEDCDIVVKDPRVSRRHCEIRLTQRGITLRDLGSKNGTSINDVAVIDAFLQPGAKVKIGGTRLSAVTGGAPSLVPLSSEGRFGDAIGKSVAMRALFAQLERVAPSSETVILLGDSGTGKDLLANAIHAASPRRDRPIVVFDCSSVAPSLVEAELFGYVRGAFTGAANARAGLLEQADGGTLFIDEIGELPQELQPKLLRALEARQVRRVGGADWQPFDARVIAATHRDLRARVADGSFREDLYYRLAVVELHVPALRERKEDIPLLVERFLAARTPPLGLDDLPPHAMDLLLAHDWPGNVRELRNTVARLTLFPDLAGSVLQGMIGAARKPAAAAAPADPAPAEEARPPEQQDRADEGLGGLLERPLMEARELVIEQFERRYLATKLRANSGNISRTAEEIGVSRQHIYRLIERYGLRGGSSEPRPKER